MTNQGKHVKDQNKKAGIYKNAIKRHKQKAKTTEAHKRKIETKLTVQTWKISTKVNRNKHRKQEE